MFYNLRNQTARKFYDWGCRSVLATPPLAIKPAPLIFCSMVSQRDLIMYLVAIKSVYTQVGEGTIHVLNDGSLTDASIALLRHQLGAPTIVNVADVGTGLCPRGGCWERLLQVLDLTENAYVIQVDSDILARRSIPDVVRGYRENRSFTLGSWAGQELTDAATSASFASQSDGEHIQLVAERNLVRLDGAAERRYVRGCAGFAGFAKGGASRRAAEAFSNEMQQLIGDRWSEWGSEQVASNYLVANTANSYVLPWPRYVSYTPSTAIDQADLLHFLGSTRFYRGYYARESRRFIASLS